MLNEKKKIVNLQIQEKVVSLMILEKDEKTVRCAAKILNDRAKEIKEKNPSLDTSSLLAYLAIEKYIENIDKNRTKTDGFFKRTVKSISEKINSLFIDE
jgi:cell division protein ZapA (FtsZ GTPase activity inhibitor)